MSRTYPGAVSWWGRARRLWRRHDARIRDVVAVLVALAGTAAQAATGAGSPAPGRHLGLVIAVCVLSAVALWWRRAHPVAVTIAAMAAFAVTTFPIPLTFALVTLAIRHRDRVLAAVAVLAYVVYVVRGVVTGTPTFGALVSGLLTVGVFVAFGAYVGARRDLVDSLRDRAEQAEAERELRSEQARLGERTRIAREMHDVLAHKVSLIALHAGALEVNPGAGPQQVERSAALIRTTARQALEDLRDVLGVLRQEEGAGAAVDGERPDLAPPPGLAQVARLVEDSEAAGVQVRLDSDLDPAVQPPEQVARTAYRVIQEGLTNVHKHARGASTVVRLAGAPGSRLLAEVRNVRPVAAETLLPGAGAGLVGLRERVGLVGGELTAGPGDDGGWLLRATLPWPADAVVGGAA